jgi:hypothetical protein
MLAAFKYPSLSFIIGFLLALIFIFSYLALFLPTVLIGMALHALVCNNMLKVVLVQEGVVDANGADEDGAETL